MKYDKLNKLNKRNTSMDIIRIIAVFSVISVHFFLHSEFYNQNVTGGNMYIMCVMRTFFSVCIPLFLILTGYLMAEKKLCKKYYLGIGKTLIIYLLASIACIIFQIEYLHIRLTFKDAILGILNYSCAPYSWYIELYIGLFLIIPFLNIIYKNLNSKRKKQVLIATLVILTVLPTLFNIFNFDKADFWLNPTNSDAKTKILPNWWISLYPITYYFTGCYLREYGLKFKTITLLISLTVSVFAFGSFNFYRSYGETFESGDYLAWNGFEAFIMAVILFTLLSRLKANKLPSPIRFVLWKVSDSALGIYLLSYIFDTITYQQLIAKVTPMTERLKYFFVIVPFVFFCSLLASLVINIVLRIVNIAINELKGIGKFLKGNSEDIQVEIYNKPDNNAQP